MSDTVITTIVGVIGTLLGAMLGWILNQLSQRGKVNFYFNEIRLFFSSSDKSNGTISLHIDVDITNTSSNQKIIRNIKAVLCKNEKNIFEKNLFVKETNAGFFSLICSPKSMKNVQLTIPQLHVEMDEEPKNFFDNDELYLKYYDEKNKVQSVCIYKNILTENPYFRDCLENQKGDEIVATKI